MGASWSKNKTSRTQVLLDSGYVMRYTSEYITDVANSNNLISNSPLRFC